MSRDSSPRRENRQHRSDNRRNRREDYDSSRHSRRDRSPHKRESKDCQKHGNRNRSPHNRPHKSDSYSNVRVKREKESPDRRGHRDRSRDRKAPKSSFLSDTQLNKKEEYEWGKRQVKTEPKETNPEEKEKPNFGLSGKLVEDTNTVNGVVIKYSEPEDAKKPVRRWRLYPFKGEQQLPVLHIHRCSAYLMGRDRKVADIPLDHPSCSKQHAALQYRLIRFKKDNGHKGAAIRPYLIDLDSANGSFINGEKIEPRKYYELFERDVIKFAMSSREYVLLHDQHNVPDEVDEDGQ